MIKDRLSILSINGKKLLIKVLCILTQKNTRIGKTCFYLGLFTTKLKLRLKIYVTSMHSLNKANKESVILPNNKTYEQYNKQSSVSSL